MPSGSDLPPLPLRQAWRRSWLIWPTAPALLATLGGAVALASRGRRDLRFGAFELGSDSLFWLSFGVLAATLPLWIQAVARRRRGRRPPALARQIAMMLGLWLAVLALCPAIAVERWQYDRYHDVTTRWRKPAPGEMLSRPFIAIDQLVWLQQGHTAAEVPADVFCAYRSLRRYALLEVSHVDDTREVLADRVDADDRAEPDVVRAVIARCRAGGPVMLRSGRTKEAALARGDTDLFFARALQEDPRDEGVVLEDGAIPAPVRARVEALLAGAEFKNDFLQNPYYASDPRQVRRLKPSALAEALGRPALAARLRAGD